MKSTSIPAPVHLPQWRDMLWGSAALLLVACAAVDDAPTSAARTGLFDVWCNPAGGRVLFEQTELSNFEGTICVFNKPLALNETQVSASAQCSLHSADGFDEVIVKASRPQIVTAHQPEPNRLQLQYDADRGLIELNRCET